MTKEESQQAHALLSLYSVLYKESYNKVPIVNRYREKLPMIDVIERVGYARARELLDYYFQTKRIGHDIKWFCQNFDKLDLSLTQKELDLTRREAIRHKTRTMIQERDNE